MTPQILLPTMLILCAAAHGQDSPESPTKDSSENASTATIFKIDIGEFTLQFADPDNVAQVLNEQFPDTKFSAEKSTKTIFGRVPESMMKDVHRFIDGVDLRAKKMRDEQEMAGREREVWQAKQSARAAAEEVGQLKLKTLRPKGIDAGDAAGILEQLGMTSNTGLDAVAANGLLILRGRPESIEDALKILETLEGEIPEQTSALNANPGTAVSSDVPLELSPQHEMLLDLELQRLTASTQLGPGHPRIMLLDKQIELAKKLQKPQPELAIMSQYTSEDPEMSVEDLQQRYEHTELLATDWGSRLRLLMAAPSTDAEQIQECSEKLVEAVAIAFAIRMQLQTQQLAKAQEELNAAQQRLDRRKKLKEQIIIRRVEELKNGESATDGPQFNRPSFGSEGPSGMDNDSAVNKLNDPPFTELKLDATGNPEAAVLGR